MTDREHTIRRRVRRDMERLEHTMRMRLMLAVILWLLIVAAVLLTRLHEVRVERSENAAPFRAATAVVQVEADRQEAAQPIVRYALTTDERAWVEAVVAAEAANQSREGQMAVAQCILNTAEAKGMRPNAVVQEEGQYASPRPERVTNSVRAAVAAVFDAGERVTEEPIRWFYAPQYSQGRWHESALEYVVTIGGHKFFKETDNGD